MQHIHWLRAQRGTAATVVITMALGIGAATAVYAVVDAVIVRALPVRDPERLVWMWNARVERDRAPFSALDLTDYRSQNTVLDGLAPFINWTANLTGVGDAERLEGMRVDPLLFDVLGVAPALGRVFVAADVHEQVAVLTHNLWRRRFGADASLVGRTVSLNGTAYTIIGILPRGFTLPFRDAEIAVPLSIDGDARRTDRGAGFLRAVGRLKRGVTIAAAKTNLDAIGARLRHDYPATNAKKLGVNLFPLGHEIVGDARTLLLILLFAVALLLLVACANMTNLLLVAYGARRRELAMRAALGAGRGRLVRQVLGEVGALAALGGVAGLLVSRGLTQLLVWWGSTALPRLDEIGLTPSVTVFAVVTTAGTALVCGLLPAWLVSETPASGLVDEGRGVSAGAAQGKYRRLFVILQIATALVLVVVMALTAKSFVKLQAVDPGFDGRAVLSAQLALPPARYATRAELAWFADRLHGDLTVIEGVRAAAAVSLMPLSGLLSTQDYRVLGRPEPPPDEVPQAHYRIATPGYFDVMGIAVEGREFTEDDREGTRRVAIISRTFAARHWSQTSPIGEHVIVGADTLEIVGVCADVQQFGLDASPTADLYVPLRQMPSGQAQFVAARMYWVLRTDGHQSALADVVRGAVRRIDPTVAASSVRWVPDVISAAIAARRFNADLMAVAGFASLTIALVGVYAVTAFSLARRAREIGIRLTLGATRGQVLRPLLRTELQAVLVGVSIGCLGAIVVSRVLSRVLFAVSPIEPATIAGCATLLTLAALTATYLPIRRAMSTDPILALRSE